MKILNLSPDSFSGDVLNASSFPKSLENLIHTEVDILDIGAVSTKPGSGEVTFEEEWNRLKGVFRCLLNFQNRLREKGRKVEISLDTSNPRIATAFCEHFPIDYINDVYAGRKNEDGTSTLDVAAQFKK